MAGITEILAGIQRKLEAPKGQYNSFGKYHYRSAEDILVALKSVLPDGCAVTLEDEIIPVGNRIYVKAIAALRCGDAQISVSAFAREADDKKGMDESQITGAASSYARKYALNGLFAIDDAKDADATNDHGQQQKAAPNPPAKQQAKAPASGKDAILGQLRHICGTDNGKAAVIEAAQGWGVTDLKNLPNLTESQLADIRDAANEIEAGI